MKPWRKTGNIILNSWGRATIANLLKSALKMVSADRYSRRQQPYVREPDLKSRPVSCISSSRSVRRKSAVMSLCSWTFHHWMTEVTNCRLCEIHDIVRKNT